MTPHAHTMGTRSPFSGLHGLSFSEAVFVGECEVCVCLEFVVFFFFLSLGREANRSVDRVLVLLKERQCKQLKPIKKNGYVELSTYSQNRP